MLIAFTFITSGVRVVDKVLISEITSCIPFLLVALLPKAFVQCIPEAGFLFRPAVCLYEKAKGMYSIKAVSSTLIKYQLSVKGSSIISTGCILDLLFHCLGCLMPG